MTIRHARTGQSEPRCTADLELARLLELLDSNQAGALTIADLRERGVRAPSQAVYTLQLAGYDIDRVHIQDPDGHGTLGYRLRASPASPEDRLAGEREAASSVA
jgi:hypothetical protein